MVVALALVLSAVFGAGDQYLGSERAVLLGGVVTGPLFGWFGRQWRTRRAIWGALITAAALCLEPPALPGNSFPRFAE